MSRRDPDDKPRCAWLGANPAMLAYHDREWGVPVRGDKPLFAKLILDGFQAGLSWAIILRKRDAFLKAFDGFNPDKMARYDARQVAKILRDPGIVRNKQKVKSAVGNARAFLEMKGAGESFDQFLWQFVGGKPKVNAWKTLRGVPAERPCLRSCTAKPARCSACTAHVPRRDVSALPAPGLMWRSRA